MMKLVVLLSTLALAIAEPQEITHPKPAITSPVSPTVKPAITSPVFPTVKTGAINTYTATYPYAGTPFFQGALPYMHGGLQYIQGGLPIIQGALPQNILQPIVSTQYSPVSSVVLRHKRSADPEPALNYPQVGDISLKSIHQEKAVAQVAQPSTLATIPTSAIQYSGLPVTQYSGLPATQYTGLPVVHQAGLPAIQYTGLPTAVPTYTVPSQTFAQTGLSSIIPYSGFQWAGLNPYTTFPSFQTTQIIKNQN